MMRLWDNIFRANGIIGGWNIYYCKDGLLLPSLILEIIRLQHTTW